MPPESNGDVMQLKQWPRNINTPLYEHANFKTFPHDRRFMAKFT